MCILLAGTLYWPIVSILIPTNSFPQLGIVEVQAMNSFFIEFFYVLIIRFDKNNFIYFTMSFNHFTNSFGIIVFSLFFNWNCQIREGKLVNSRTILVTIWNLQMFYRILIAKTNKSHIPSKFILRIENTINFFILMFLNFYFTNW